MKRLLLCLALAGCGATPPFEPEAVDDTCGASDYQSLVGSPVAAVQLPADLNLRIYGPGDMVTQEFDATRINLETDGNGRIIRVICG